MPNHDSRLSELVHQYRAATLSSNLVSVLSDFIIERKTSSKNENKQGGSNLEQIVPNGQAKPEVSTELEASTTFSTTFPSMSSIVDNVEAIPERFGETGVEHFDAYFLHGCGCNRRCHTRFDKKAAFKARLDSLGLDQFGACHVNHQHLMLLGTLNSLMKGQETKPRRSKTRERKNARTAFYFRSQPVCRHFFLYVNGAGIRRFKNLQQQFQTNGLQARAHESASEVRALDRLDAHQQHRLALVFIANFAEANSLQLPGRWQQTSTSYRDLFYLPTQASFTRKAVFEAYADVCRVRHLPSISYSLFSELWRLHFPNILLADDESREPCLECRAFSRNLATGNEVSRLNATTQHLAHLREINIELEDYHSCIERSCGNFRIEKEKRTIDCDPTLGIGTDEALLVNLCGMHYTLDWYSTISLPYLACRGNELHLENGYKVAMLGIAIEPVGKFVLYIVPEAVCHAPEQLGNITLSLLDHCHRLYRYFEKETILHIANSSTTGLRTSLLLSYWMWRTLQGQTDRTLVSYLPEAHAHTWNDLLMGALRKKLRSCQLASLAELKTLADNCLRADDEGGGIKFQVEVYLVGDDEGRLGVPLIDWQQRLALFSQLNGDTIMARMRHFEINSELPGLVLCRPTVAGPVVSYKLFNIENLSLVEGDEAGSMQLTLAQLSHERRTYLQKTIVPLVDERYRSLRLWNFGPLEIKDGEDEDDDEQPTRPSKRPKLLSSKSPRCTYCLKLGHRQSTFGRISCPEKKQDSKLTKSSEVVAAGQLYHPLG